MPRKYTERMNGEYKANIKINIALSRDEIKELNLIAKVFQKENFRELLGEKLYICLYTIYEEFDDIVESEQHYLNDDDFDVKSYLKAKKLIMDA